MTVVKLRPQKEKRKLRVRKKVSGTYGRPRLSVFKSNKYTSGQLIDDISGKTLVSLSLIKIKELHNGKNKTEAAFEVGKELAKAAQTQKFAVCMFDRSSFRYHGRVKSFADGAREGGLSF